MPYSKRQFIHFGRSALALWLVGMILLLNAMAACPALHELIHKDADSAIHSCAVTVFAHGKVESATVEVPISMPTLLVEAAPRIEFCVFGAAIENLPPGRAPPCSFFSPNPGQSASADGI